MRIYFASPNSSDLKILRDEGADRVLISYADKSCRRLVESAVALDMEVALDSGAYSARRRGVSIDIAAYAAFAKTYPFAFVANLDVIGDAQRTAENQDRLEELGIQALPVYHIGSCASELEKLVQLYEYIGLGGTVRVNRLQVGDWIYEITQKYSKHRFHGFGIGTLKPKFMGLYSADSTTWIQGRAFGHLVGKTHKYDRIVSDLFFTAEEVTRNGIRSIFWQSENTEPYEENFFKGGTAML